MIIICSRSRRGGPSWPSPYQCHQYDSIFHLTFIRCYVLYVCVVGEEVHLDPVLWPITMNSNNKNNNSNSNNTNNSNNNNNNNNSNDNNNNCVIGEEVHLDPVLTPGTPNPLLFISCMCCCLSCVYLCLITVALLCFTPGAPNPGGSPRTENPGVGSARSDTLIMYK